MLLPLLLLPLIRHPRTLTRRSLLPAQRDPPQSALVPPIGSGAYVSNATRANYENLECIGTLALYSVRKGVAYKLATGKIREKRQERLDHVLLKAGVPVKTGLHSSMLSKPKRKGRPSNINLLGECPRFQAHGLRPMVSRPRALNLSACSSSLPHGSGGGGVRGCRPGA